MSSRGSTNRSRRYAPRSRYTTTKGASVESETGSLESIDKSLRQLSTDVQEDRQARQHSTRVTRWWIAATVGLVLLVAFIGYEANEGRLANRNKSRCDIRSGFIDLANSVPTDPTLVLDAIRRYDARLTAAGIPSCGGVSLCRDGFYSESVGRGSCSSHGGVERILIPG